MQVTPEWSGVFTKDAQLNLQPVPARTPAFEHGTRKLDGFPTDWCIRLAYNARHDEEKHGFNATGDMLGREEGGGERERESKREREREGERWGER